MKRVELEESVGAVASVMLPAVVEVVVKVVITPDSVTPARTRT